MERENQANGEFGFARELRVGLDGAPARLRLVHAKDEKALPSMPKVAFRPEVKIAVEAPPAQPPTSSVDDHGWVVRPKAAGPVMAAPKVRRLRARKPRKSAIAADSPPDRAAAPETNIRYRRWLALAMAGMVYVTGVAGLWSMVQTFEPRPSPVLTPAGESGILPPIDKEVDVRDAKLEDGLFHPQFKPEIPDGNGEDVAVSNFQNRI